jgi:hypothetical protein
VGGRATLRSRIAHRRRLRAVRGRALTIAVSTIAIMTTAQPALGWSVTRQDPDDFEIAPDVHSSTRQIFRVDGHPWRLRITVRGELGPDYRLRVLLDTRGGPNPDVVMVTTVRDLDRITCAVYRLEGSRLDANCDADPFEAWWGVARSDLDRTKLIRWRIAAFGGTGLREMTDRAPDAGWYA